MQLYLNYRVSTNKLSKDEHLKAPNGQVVTADGGTMPKVHDGWMWDLTVQDDHDFYVLNRPESSDSSTSSAQAPADSVSAVLVHNCNTANPQDLNPTHEISGDSSSKRVASMRNQMRTVSLTGKIIPSP